MFRKLCTDHFGIYDFWFWGVFAKSSKTHHEIIKNWSFRLFWSSGSVKNSSGMYFSSYLIWWNPGQCILQHNAPRGGRNQFLKANYANNADKANVASNAINAINAINTHIASHALWPVADAHQHHYPHIPCTSMVSWPISMDIAYFYAIMHELCIN